MKENLKRIWEKYNALCSWILVFAVLGAAAVVCTAILHWTETDNNAPAVFLLAVVIISRMTREMHYGLTAALLSTLIVNYFFAYPYRYFQFGPIEYPVEFICFMTVAIVVGLLTYQVRNESAKAIQKEKEKVELYEKNRKLEEKRASAELVAEKEKLHSNLLRAVSHDVRTPLTAIAGASGVLIENDAKLSDEERKKMEKNIHDEALWLIQMVENLLSITRFQNNEAVHLNEQEELIEEILEESITKFHRRFPKQEVLVAVPEEVLFVPMDAMLIEQVLINLLENAVRHSGSREPIDVRVTHEENKVWFSVRDHGKGIPEEKLSELFTGSMHEDDGSRGMGIGLSLCKSIVLAHRGMLSCENAPDHGAEFRFWLPLEDKKLEELA